MTIRKYTTDDLNQMIDIWNEVVEEGISFPQEELLDHETGDAFFASQSYCGTAIDDSGAVVGLYILHPNNIGRCGHICNASFAVASSHRGQHFGEKLVMDCINKAKEIGFRILQFNAVVETNTHARHLYERIGFTQSGVIPKGFRMKDGTYENICPYYLVL
ncbi:MAG: GNAT family N-acetyltransferase [Ruminiclostridium sp.]|nr:GNAT family N-acetyltransferase [Ruminiclostridium sp.]